MLKKWFVFVFLMMTSMASVGAERFSFDFSAADKVSEHDKAMMQKAKKGNAKAQYLVGKLFCCSKHVKYDPLKSAFWIFRSAGKGYMDAQFRSGYIHANGMGVKKDMDKALIMYNKALEQGHVGAMFRVGEMYLRRRGC